MRTGPRSMSPAESLSPQGMRTNVPGTFTTPTLSPVLSITMRSMASISLPRGVTVSSWSPTKKRFFISTSASPPETACT